MASLSLVTTTVPPAPHEPSDTCKIAAHDLVAALDRGLDDLPDIRDQHALLRLLAMHLRRRIDSISVATRGELASAKALLF